MQPLTNQLLDAASIFLVKLRQGRGFDEQAFEELCACLIRCREEWRDLDAIPKLAASVLVVLYSSLDALRYFYHDEEAERIQRAAATIDELVVKSVEVEGESEIDMSWAL